MSCKSISLYPHVLGQIVSTDRQRLDAVDFVPAEATDLADSEADRVERMRIDLEAWLRSVVASLNGKDYGG